MNGACVACKATYWTHDEGGKQLCTLCWTSPFYTEQRKPMTIIAEAVKTDGGGLRYDEGKERVDLLPADALMVLGSVYGVGAKKYTTHDKEGKILVSGERNWERGMPWSKVLGPLLRHLFKWMRGEKIDPTDGQLHIAKVAWNAIALLTYEIRGIGTDDIRPAKTCGDRLT